jgi:hypothetical protein
MYMKDTKYWKTGPVDVMRLCLLRFKVLISVSLGHYFLRLKVIPLPVVTLSLLLWTGSEVRREGWRADDLDRPKEMSQKSGLFWDITQYISIYYYYASEGIGASIDVYLPPSSGFIPTVTLLHRRKFHSSIRLSFSFVFILLRNIRESVIHKIKRKYNMKIVWRISFFFLT